MRYFHRICGYNISALQEQVSNAKHLWNRHGPRIKAGPFIGTHDMWLRFREHVELLNPNGSYNPNKFLEPHKSVWYDTLKTIPAARAIALDLMRRVEATSLGGVLITRIPPGVMIKTHNDRGGWHAEHYNYKAYVVIEDAGGHCHNYCGHGLHGSDAPTSWNHDDIEVVAMKKGEAWYFNNLIDHRVVNAGKSDRTTLIVCMRRD
jgi:Aspartyl/Asparaginyl beta-hydroxylase